MPNLAPILYEVMFDNKAMDPDLCIENRSTLLFQEMLKCDPDRGRAIPFKSALLLLYLFNNNPGRGRRTVDTIQPYIVELQSDPDRG